VVAAGNTTVQDLIRRLNDWLRVLPPEQERITKLIDDLQARFGERTDPVTATVCREIEAAAWAYSRHLELAFDPSGTGTPDEHSHGWPDPDLAEVRRRAAAVTCVERLSTGLCYIRLDGLEPVVAAHPYVTAAFTLARDATGIVLDVRNNGGGDPATLALIAGLLLGDASTHLSDVTYRDRRRQWWTPDFPSGTAISTRLPVAILIGPGTFSSSEALAYHLQCRQRVTVIGETTPGAADHVTPIRLAGSVTALLPEAYVTDAASGVSWEGGGVAPDVACPADQALKIALSRMEAVDNPRTGQVKG
jgi:hypothetical protein